MFDSDTIAKLYEIYKKKSFVTLEDIKVAFGTESDNYAKTIMNRLISEGYLERVAETSYPIKFELDNSAFQIETIDLSQTC